MASNDTLYSIWGMYNYDNSLFDGFDVPEGVDKEVAIDDILLQTAQLEVYYANIEFMKTAITAWTKKHLFAWSKQWEALSAEFNPIENYDRYEEWTDTGEDHMQGRTSGTMSNQNSASSTNSGTTSSTGSDTQTNSVNGYNLNEGWADHDKNVTSDSRTGTSSDTGTSTASGSATSSGTNNEDRAKTDNHSGHVHGNIGVTTATQMIQGILELHQTTIYDIITNDFIDAFCLRVYS